MVSLIDGFAESVRQYPDRVALDLDGRRWTYGALGEEAARVAGALLSHGPSGDLVGVVAGESLSAYTGVLGALWAGRGFLPVDPCDPPRRIEQMLDHGRVGAIVVGREAMDRLEGVLGGSGRPLVVIAPEVPRMRDVAARWARHRVVGAKEVARSAAPQPQKPTGPAYLIYTSGRSATPRGVAIEHAQVVAYLEAVRRRWPLEPGARCSHTFPLTFDLSVHDLFTTWAAGATLVVWPSRQRSQPGRFIEHHRLHRWFCVPSVAVAMARLGELRPGRFRHLKEVFFCGEPLPAQVAYAFSQAAPFGKVINLYGPTEATVAVASHGAGRGGLQEAAAGPVVPLGRPFEGVKTAVIDEAGRPQRAPGQGELVVGGPRVARGYWRDAEESRRRFVDLPQVGLGRWFRTGDRVAIDDRGCLHYLGRLDEEIKLRGHHVVLAAVDRALQRGCGHPQAAAVGWPADEAGVYGLVGCVVSDEEVNTQDVLAQCRRELPPASVPDRVVTIGEWPMNGRGKLDRQRLLQILQRGEV